MVKPTFFLVKPPFWVANELGPHIPTLAPPALQTNAARLRRLRALGSRFQLEEAHHLRFRSGFLGSRFEKQSYG